MNIWSRWTGGPYYLTPEQRRWTWELLKQGIKRNRKERAMTRGEAMRELAEWMKQMKDHGVPPYSAKYKALDMAIEALQTETKHGKWEESPTGWIACSVCGNEPPSETNIATDYCPNCGAKMEEAQQATEHDGCEGCKYTHKDQYEMPCLMCRQSKQDLWEEKK